MTKGWKFPTVRGEYGEYEYTGEVGDMTLRRGDINFVDVEFWEGDRPFADSFGYGVPQWKDVPINTTADGQVGGDWYKILKITPYQYAMQNDLDALQFNIVKYVTRFRNKDGMKDLMKARDTLNQLIEWEEQNAATASTK